MSGATSSLDVPGWGWRIKRISDIVTMVSGTNGECCEDEGRNGREGRGGGVASPKGD